MKTKITLLIDGFFLVALTSAFAQSSFTKITTGAIVNDGGNSFGCAWGDYDNDGYLDLFVGNAFGQKNFLYRNNGNGTFAKLTSGLVVNDVGDSNCGTWADYDNDGNLDIFVTNYGVKNFLYRNIGGGSFVKVTTGSIVNDIANSIGCAWGDYDNDGNLDLFVANEFGRNFLYHNGGDGTFVRITSGIIVNDAVRQSTACAWGDYDGDGYRDLYGTNHGIETNFLYHNERNGTFSKVTTGIVATDLAVHSAGCAWGDYDNDGSLDLFVANSNGTNNFLYHNDGDGTFTKVTSGAIVTDVGDFKSGVWGDYDNDGWLDLFVSARGQKNYLYRNNGDGTFSTVATGSLVNDEGVSFAAAWVDYDQDGFLDVFVANGGPIQSENNFLYRNNGNSNNWIKIKCIGTVSNRSAIGTKVRLRTTIAGKTIWQLREISGSDGLNGQSLDVHFGLGDAKNVDVVRIQWPSGTLQEFNNVAMNQFLTITEPPRLQALGQQPDGSFQFEITDLGGSISSVETSTNLIVWTPWLTVTNLSRTTLITDPSAKNAERRFYRAVRLP